MRDKIAEIIRNARMNANPLAQVGYAEADALITNGFILPPMRLGQICYESDSWQDEAAGCRVSSITQKADGTFKIRLTNLRGKWVFEITAEDIGKTVFLTKEEAEKALKEKENDNNT